MKYTNYIHPTLNVKVTASVMRLSANGNARYELYDLKFSALHYYNNNKNNNNNEKQIVFEQEAKQRADGLLLFCICLCFTSDFTA